MTIFLYYCVVFIVLILASPLLIFKEKARAGLWQKLGVVPENFEIKSPCVWFHSVSVGEFHAIKTLLALFSKEHPEIPVIVSTTTRTGQTLAQETVGSWAKVVYMPFDLPWSVSAWLERTKPSLVVIAETEIWPGLAYQCKQRGINLVVVNGRISPRSFKNYSRLRSFFASVLANFTAFGVQAESEAQRYRALAAPKKIDVEILGNLKLDGLTAHDASATERLRNDIGVSANDIVFIAGSTHEGEEAAVIEAFTAAKKQFKNLKLIIAPRHPERFDRAHEIITRAGLTCARNSAGQKFGSETDVLLVDAMGLLTKLYSISHIAFVGGSIAKIGGHNLMEPYLYNVPVICGPNIQKTRDTAAQLDHMGAIFIVPDEKIMSEKLLLLLSNEQMRLEMGAKGNEFLLISRGATERALAYLNRFLPSASSAAKKDAVPASKDSHK